MFEGKKRKKVKLKGKTQILKQKQTSFLLRLQTCCTAVAKTSVQQVCKLGFQGERGFLKSTRDWMVCCFLFCFCFHYYTTI